jgi:hypothetical protein
MTTRIPRQRARGPLSTLAAPAGFAPLASGLLAPATPPLITRPAYSPATDAGVPEYWDPTTLTPGAVAAWIGRKLGASLAQGTGGAQPVYSATAIGGAYPGTTFDGVDDILATAGVGATLAGLAGFWFVGAFVDATAATKVVCGYGVNGNSDNGGEFVVNDAGALELLTFQATGPANTFCAGALASVAVVALGLDFTNTNGCVAIRVNGVAQSVTRLGTITAGTAPNKSLFLGARSGGVLPWPGTVGPFGLVAGVAQGASLDRFERWVGGRVGLSW